MHRKPPYRRTAPARLAAVVTGLACLLVCTYAAFAQHQKRLLHRSTAKPVHTSPRPAAASARTAVLPAGLPLRIQLNHRYRMRKGMPVTGRLIAPVYSGSRIVLPVHTLFRGSISELVPLESNQRTWALLDGDVTPLKKPILTFTALKTSTGLWVPLDAKATSRTAALITMTAQHRESLIAKAKLQVEAKKKTAEGVLHSHHKSGMALKYLYAQLPYHPLEIWAGTQFDAVLQQPLTLTIRHPGKPIPFTPPRGHLPPGTVHVRLLNTVNSATDKVGDPIRAVLTQPYFNASRTSVILPTGTLVAGLITQAEPARKFARNGKLRFSFRRIKLPSGTYERMHGQMTAVEGAKGQHLTVDSEGGAKASAGPGQVLAPLLLGALASNSFDSDQNAVHAGVSSNGFGLITRIIAFVVVSPPMTATFAYYSLGKSVTRRWLMPGHNVVFRKNTRMELSIADR